MNADKSSKIYSAIKNRITFIEILLNLALLLLFAFTPITSTILMKIQSNFYNEYVQFIIFILIYAAFFTSLGFAVSYYSSFIIEHDFKLSNQTIEEWKIEQIKSTLLSGVITLPLALAFYYFLKVTGESWWIYFGILVFTVSIIIAQLAPVIIMPLFYKFIPIQNDEIKLRLSGLLGKFNIQSKNIYTFNLSKNTKKANAGLTGFGATKRIILSDTLIENFTPEEIEVIFAHELGHFTKKHIIKNIILSGAIIFSSFYLCSLLYKITLEKTGYFEYNEISTIPALFLYISVFSFMIMPLTNTISRFFEREADRFAVQTTGRPQIFIDAMNKLSRINLANKEPNRIIEFIFYSHPSISRRIKHIEDFMSGRCRS